MEKKRVTKKAPMTIYDPGISDDRSCQSDGPILEECGLYRSEAEAIRALADWIKSDVEDQDDRIAPETAATFLALHMEGRYRDMIDQYPQHCDDRLRFWIRTRQLAD